MSWIVGIVVHHLLRKTPLYTPLTRLQYAPSPHFYQWLGLHYFKWLITHTPFKWFNQNIHLPGKNGLQRVYASMTSAEISHLLAFAFVTLVAFYKTLTVDLPYGLTLMLLNIPLNLYPALLQQYHKQRIRRLLSQYAQNNTSSP